MICSLMVSCAGSILPVSNMDTHATHNVSVFVGQIRYMDSLSACKVRFGAGSQVEHRL